MLAYLVQGGELDWRTDEEYRFVLERRHDDLVRGADAVNICWAIRDGEVAGIDHAEIDMKCLPELSRTPRAGLSAFPSAFIGPARFDPFAALGVLAAIFVQAADVRLEPRIENRCSHRLQEFADPIAPAELSLGRSRGDEIHRARQINARAPEQTMFTLPRHVSGLRFDVNLCAVCDEFLGFFFEPFSQCIFLFYPLLCCIFANVFRDSHRAEMRAAHTAEMGQLRAILRQGFIMKLTGGDWVEAEIELIFPSKLESSFAQGVVTIAGRRMPFGEVGSVGGNFVSDYAIFDILLVWQSKMLLGRDIAKHSGAIPTNHRRADSASNVVVAGSDVSRQWTERVKWSFTAPLELLVHILFDEVHGNMAWAFVHDLAIHVPRDLGQFALRLQFGELRFVISISN